MRDATGTVAVVGTGTMGQGIAQVALLAGHTVRLHDVAPDRAAQAAEAVLGRLDRLVDKGRLDAEERAAAAARLHAHTGPDGVGDLADADVVVEAILEDLGAKQQLFTALEQVVSDETLLATNTSSLSVTAIAAALRLPGRFVGLHFFNPAPLLPLVEIVSGHATDEATAERAVKLATAWGKTPVRCADTPGFIVNRVARPYYAEAFRVYEERAADPATIDAVLRESGGFRMGPFELTDLIGQDVNESVTRSVWDSFFQDVKFTPSLAQRRLVQSGRLGRKTGRGWYDHTPGASRPEPHTARPCPAPEYAVPHGGLGPAAALPALAAEAGIALRTPAATAEGPTTPGDTTRHGCLELPGGALLRLADGSQPRGREIHFDLALDYRTATRVALAPADAASVADLAEATGFFQALGKAVSVIEPVPGMIVARTVAMLADFAADTVGRGVAGAGDVDTAMRLGVNYPVGPLRWCDDLGADWVADVLHNLHREYPTGRYAPGRSLLRRKGAES
ncbi:3-hydroxyacyl-CoA dehydrogenase [Streptomyces alkaliterrae]|uniref:3-hydroxyacyl-CoA dehydrogenase n=1 Tax=Streptomyces alkaliterrae TaxID=2213162 RepID=A0A5P0YUB9_9ACTN|nr:3-hydroxyacyl-CoA dehydrogenase [Streptomyces alkaliterrae]MBB1259670.1 3-hydroxyacyl-CoA dehydrogenase [Streptomyces alkaliterrae]MQS03906.1 3-hydroxyacyl-CoA dehydrogenase [Streptomyces alkaliterrae]